MQMDSWVTHVDCWLRDFPWSFLCGWIFERGIIGEEGRKCLWKREIRGKETQDEKEDKKKKIKVRSVVVVGGGVGERERERKR